MKTMFKIAVLVLFFAACHPGIGCGISHPKCSHCSRAGVTLSVALPWR